MCQYYMWNVDIITNLLPSNQTKQIQKWSLNLRVHDFELNFHLFLPIIQLHINHHWKEKNISNKMTYYILSLKLLKYGSKWEPAARLLLQSVSSDSSTINMINSRLLHKTG